MREQAMSIRAALNEGSLETAIPDPPPLTGPQGPQDEGWENEKWWDEPPPDQEES